MQIQMVRFNDEHEICIQSFTTEITRGRENFATTFYVVILNRISIYFNTFRKLRVNKIELVLIINEEELKLVQLKLRSVWVAKF